MFEKCGLRDIFVRIGKLKWLLLIFVIVGAAAGSLMYMRNVDSYKQAKVSADKYAHKMYTGYAYFYNSVSLGGADTSAKRVPALAATYKRIYSLRSTSKAIYKRLLKKYSEDEMGELLDAKRYADSTVDGNKLFRKSYGMRAIASSNMVEISVCAETKEMASDLLNACQEQLIAIAEKIPDATVELQGHFLRHEMVDSDFFKSSSLSASANKTESSETENSAADSGSSAPAKTTILIWALIGLLAGIIVAIASAIFVPSINRLPDFDFYKTKALGQPGKNGAGAAVHIIKKILEKSGSDKVVVVSTLSGNKRVSAFFNEVKNELQAGDKNMAAVMFEGKDCFGKEAGDGYEDAGVIVALEKRGVTKHHKYEAMQHYIEMLDRKIEGAFLLS